MAVAKKRCKHCKKYFPSEQMIKSPAGMFCTREHQIEFALDKNNQKRAKAKIKNEEKKKHAKRKREFYENDLKTRRKAAKQACHAYIRERDKGNPCICCGRPLGEKFDAGHYLESGNNPRIRYDERNIHAQSVYCNQYKGGDSDDYRGNLIRKIGRANVEELENLKGGTVKRTAQDYKEIEIYYKKKLKGLLNG